MIPRKCESTGCMKNATRWFKVGERIRAMCGSHGRHFVVSSGMNNSWSKSIVEMTKEEIEILEVHQA